MARYAISDIHGCLKTFNQLLEQIRFSKNDELYLLGDYVDRGPDSAGTVLRIMELQDQGYAVKALMGNHEEMTINDYQRQPHLLHGYSDQQIRWMMQLPSYLEIPGYLLVHAGFNFKKEDPLEDVESMRWIRHWLDDINREWLGDRCIVYGHSPQSYHEIKRDLKYLKEIPAVCIDAGCAFAAFSLGYLAALDLDSLELHSLRRIDVV